MKLLLWNLIQRKIMLPPTPTQHYLVWNTVQRKISSVTSFSISKWLKCTILRQKICTSKRRNKMKSSEYKYKRYFFMNFIFSLEVKNEYFYFFAPKYLICKMFKV